MPRKQAAKPAQPRAPRGSVGPRQLLLRLPDDLADGIARAASAAGVSVAQWMRDAATHRLLREASR